MEHTMTLARMQQRLAEACTIRLRQWRRVHKKWRNASHAPSSTKSSLDERFWRGVLIQSKLDAVEMYDLLQESVGKGRDAHYMKQNARDVRRAKMRANKGGNIE